MGTEGMLVLVLALEQIRALKNIAHLQAKAVEGLPRQRDHILILEEDIQIYCAGARRLLEERIATVPGAQLARRNTEAHCQRSVELGLELAKRLARALFQVVEKRK